MRYNSLLRSPKKEEQQVPDAVFPILPDSTKPANEEFDILDKLDGVLGTEDDENLAQQKTYTGGQLNWDFMEWEEEFPAIGEEAEDDEEKKQLKMKGTENRSICRVGEKMIKREAVGFLEEDDEKMVSLNLNLNYQEVLDAWSDRGPLRADGYSLSMATNNGYYMGEVPVMEEERTRREASVLRYKQKRQSRFFSKKIRYQVRKLNADKRPRIKGRFVKRL